MVPFAPTFARLATSIVFIGNVVAAPTLTGLVERAKDLVPTAPRFVVYSDLFVSGAAPAVSEVTGFNTFALSFLLSSGPADQAQEWMSLSSDQRSTIKQQYADAGIAIIVSAFGSTEQPTTSGLDPVATANTMADWVKEFDLDGIDVDYEDFTAFNNADGPAEPWLASFTKQLRAQLPAGDFILTHAPVAPWYSDAWSGGGYLAIDQAVGDLIDWYNVQFYNQGTDEYTTCDNLLNTSRGTFPGSALFEIAANGVDQDKLVIGKPATSGDASNGFIDPSTLAGCVAQAANKGWNAGVMTWEFPDGDSDWIETVRSQAFPV
ncbi:glycoside hydrolase family 18 protein [Amylostereum chailletii]|nr:glycoside hydrolase family 18 protein [Amylostereum chailletii]